MTAETVLHETIKFILDRHEAKRAIEEECRQAYIEAAKAGINKKALREVVRRQESDDPLQFVEFDEKVQQYMESYCRAQNLAQNVHSRTRASRADQLPSPAVPSPNTAAVEAAGAAKPEPASAVLEKTDTGGSQGQCEPTVPVSSANADDKLVPLKRDPAKVAPNRPPTVFAKYANGKAAAS